MTFRATSFNYLNAAQPEHVTANLDRDMKIIYNATTTIDSTAIKAPTFGGGFSMAAGTIDVLAGVKSGLATGLAQVNQVVCTLNAGQGVPLNLWVTAQPSPTIAGAVDIFVWQPTSSSNNTPVAATGNFVTHWIAVGTSPTST